MNCRISRSLRDHIRDLSTVALHCTPTGPSAGCVSLPPSLSLSHTHTHTHTHTATYSCHKRSLTHCPSQGWAPCVLLFCCLFVRFMGWGGSWISFSSFLSLCCTCTLYMVYLRHCVYNTNTCTHFLSLSLSLSLFPRTHTYTHTLSSLSLTHTHTHTTTNTHTLP